MRNLSIFLCSTWRNNFKPPTSVSILPRETELFFYQCKPREIYQSSYSCTLFLEKQNNPPVLFYSEIQNTSPAHILPEDLKQSSCYCSTQKKNPSTSLLPRALKQIFCKCEPTVINHFSHSCTIFLEESNNPLVPVLPGELD